MASDDNSYEYDRELRKLYKTHIFSNEALTK